MHKAKPKPTLNIHHIMIIPVKHLLFRSVTVYTVRAHME